MKLRAVFLIVLSALASAAIASAQTADIDFGTSEQTIRGFGGSTAWMPQMSTAQADALFGTGSGQLGLSILRVRIDYSSTTGGANWATELANAQEAIALGANVNLRHALDPAYCLEEQRQHIEGTLNTSEYAAYANYLNALHLLYGSRGRNSLCHLDAERAGRQCHLRVLCHGQERRWIPGWLTRQGDNDQADDAGVGELHDQLTPSGARGCQRRR